MDLKTFEERYLKITASYARIVGIWPYQKFYQKLIMHGVVNALVILALVTQVARIVVYFSAEAVVDQIPFLMVAFATFIKYSNYMFNGEKFKHFYNSMLKDWQATKTNEEQTIMEKYANRGVFFIFIYIMNAYFCVTVFLFLPLMPHIMNVISPLNESRPRIQMYEGYYFVKDQEEYYYSIMLYTIVSLLTAMCTFIASDTTLVYAVQHCCGLLALAGHRFKYGLDEVHWLAEDSKVDIRKSYRNICYAVYTHERALAFLIEIENVYAMNLFVQLGVVILSFTITMLKVASITLSMDTYPYYGYLIAQLVHIFFLTVQGQFVIERHDKIYENGYAAYWYNGDCRTQALYLLILRKSLTPPLLTAGGLIELNLDSFAQIVKTCVSYFTVLKST